MTLGEKIKELRTEKGMTQSDLAAATGLAKTSISNYERDRHTPQASSDQLTANVRRKATRRVEKLAMIPAYRQTKRPVLDNFSAGC